MNPMGTCGFTNSSKKVYYVIRRPHSLAKADFVYVTDSYEVRAHTSDIPKSAARFATVVDAAHGLAKALVANTWAICRVEETTIPGEDTVSTDLAPVGGCWYVLRAGEGDNSKFSTKNHAGWLSPRAEERFPSVEEALRGIAWAARNCHILPARILRVTPGSPKVTRTITPVE